MAQPFQFFLENRPAHGDTVFLFQIAFGADDRLGQHAVLGEDKQAVRILVEPPDRCQFAFETGVDIRRAEDIGPADHADGRGFARFRLPGYNADRLVIKNGHAGIERRRATLIERQCLAGFDLVTGGGYGFAVDAHEALFDERVSLAPRTDAALRQPLVDPYRFVAIVCFVYGHVASYSVIAGRASLR